MNVFGSLGGAFFRGFGRTIGKFVAGIFIAFLIYSIINLLGVDVKNDIISRILFLDVKAVEQKSNVVIKSNSLSSCGGGSNNTYCATQTNQLPYIRNINTTYSGVLQCIEFEYTYQFQYSSYILTIEGMSTDFRNNSLAVYPSTYQTYPANAVSENATLRFVSKSKLQVHYDVASSPASYQNHIVSICSNTKLTGDTNYGIKKVYLSYDDGQQDISGIIQNANQNTTDIINNINNNFNDVGNVLNEQLTQENNNSRQQSSNNCKNLYFTPIGKGKTINSGGSLVDDAAGYYMLDYVAINNINDSSLGGTANRLYIVNPATAPAGYYFAFYDTNKNLISVERTATRSMTIPSNAVWFRFGSTSSDTLVYRYINKCITGSDVTNNSITNPDIENGTGESFFNDFEDEDFGLSNIITIPLNTIQSLTSKSCLPLEVPIPFTNNQKITLPCMTQIYENKFNSLYNLWKIVSFGIVAYYIAIDIFHMVKGFKDPESDKVEVLDL